MPVEMSARCRVLVPIMIASVLSALTDKLLRSISQCWAALKQSDVVEVDEMLSTM